MKKTYITTMPDHIGAFLKASECFAELGINITRVSYNKAVDSHTLFIDVDGEEEQLKKADRQLTRIGYLQTEKSKNSIALLEFSLRDEPGGVRDVLRLIDRYKLNISYISSQENGTGFQSFKTGLFVDDESRMKEFLSEVQLLCPVRVLDYNHSEKVYDNSIFYQSFVSGLMQTIGLPEALRDTLLVNSNLVMQMLDEKGLSPYKTFESISRYADILASTRGSAFAPRITRHRITDRTELTLIEPPCGSNTMILNSLGKALFIDCGYALYREEMEKLLRQLLPGFDTMRKTIFITHADLDHCGLLPLFDEILASQKTKDCLSLEHSGQNGFREQNPIHKPYICICKAMTFYEPPDPEKITALWDLPGEQTEPLAQMGFFDFGELHFEVYQGKGGHLPGETILIDYAHHIAFTGDVFINTHGLTAQQAEHNQYAPVLMTSVDTDPALCALERKAVFDRLGAGPWQIFGSHGMKKEYTLRVE